MNAVKMPAKWTSCVLIAAGALLVANPMALALEIPKQAYQAEYELTSQNGKSIHKMAADGKGHGRSEMISANRRSASIIDYGKREITILNPASKSAMTMSLSDEMLKGMGEVGDNVRKTAKPLGQKVIDGHMCTGNYYDLGSGSNQEIWTGNDIGGIRVYSKVNMPSFGTQEAHLKSYVPGAPAADAFSIPSDYRK